MGLPAGKEHLRFPAAASRNPQRGGAAAFPGGRGRAGRCHGSGRRPGALKWPNDLYLGGRKAAGILSEMASGPERVRHVVVGRGST